MSSLLDAAIKGTSSRNSISGKDRAEFGRRISEARHNSPEAAKARKNRKRKANHAKKFNR